MRETLSSVDRSSELKSIAQHELKRPNAAVGQSGLMALYEAMFRNYGLIVGQVLVTKQDFINDDTRGQLFNTLREMLALNIIPIINTNDAVSPPPSQTMTPLPAESPWMLVRTWPSSCPMLTASTTGRPRKMVQTFSPTTTQIGHRTSSLGPRAITAPVEWSPRFNLPAMLWTMAAP